MNGPNLISTNYNSNSPNLSFNIIKRVAGEKANNKIIQVFFGSPNRPILSIISSSISSNTIKVYKCLKTNTHILIKVEGNRIYRLTGPKLICIIVNNIDTNWDLVCTHKNLNDIQIKDLYNTYKIK